MNDRIRDYCLRRGCSIFEVEGGLEYFVRTWERTVADISRGYPGLLAQQFTTDLRTRQLLHEVWPLATVDERRAFGGRLHAADELYLKHTTVVETSMAVPAGGSNGTERAYGSQAFVPQGLASEQWWYGREPKVRDEDW